MTEHASTRRPGWYQLETDPPGVQRYWDGNQWVNQLEEKTVAPRLPGPPAEIGQRIVSYLIDFGLVFGVLVIASLVGRGSTALGTIGIIAFFGIWCWNCFRQGSTGQTIGMSVQSTKLVADATGEPVGVPLAFVRYLLLWIASFVTCGLLGSLDALWVLWDKDRKRLVDKLFNFSVVAVQDPIGR